MKSEDKLTTLIKSLSESEKKNFKKQFRHSSEWELFGNLFESLTDKKQVSPEAKIAPDKNNAYQKRLLFNSLLVFLESFSPSDTFETNINNLINRAKILFDRGMYHECQDLLSEARILAIKYEVFLKIIEICDLEIALISKIHHKEVNLNYEKVLHNKTEAIENYNNQTEYYKVFSQINNFFIQYQALKNNEGLQEIEKMILSDLMKNYHLAKTFYSQFYYYSAHQLFAVLKGKDTLKLKAEHVQLWESNPNMKEKNPALYFNALSTYMISCLQAQQYQDFSYTLKKAQKIIVISERDKINFAYRLYRHQSDVLIRRGDLKQLIKLSEETVKELKYVYQFPNFYARIFMGMEFSLCLTYFLGGEYKKGLKHINLLLNNLNVKNEQWQFLFYSIKLLQLLTVFETKDYPFLADLLKSARMYLQRHHALTPLALLLINHLNGVLFDSNNEDFQKKFIELRNTIAKSKRFEIFSVFGFDITIWIDSKIDLIPMSEVIYKRAKLEYPAIFSIEL